MKNLRNNSGSILIIALYVISFLAMLALSLSHYARRNQNFTKRSMGRLGSRYIAQGVLAQVISALADDKGLNKFDYKEENWIQKYRPTGIPEELDFLDTSGKVIGKYSVVVIDESNRINVNTADYTMFVQLLKNFEKLPAEEIARKIIALREDSGEIEKFYSAYELMKLESLPSKIFIGEDTNENGRLDDWEKDGSRSPSDDNQNNELDLGLKDFLTIHTDGKININTAPKEILLSMPDITADIASALIDQRDKKPFEDLEDVKMVPLVTDAIYGQMISWATVGSDWFKILIHARFDNDKIGKRILAIVDRSGEFPKIKYWRESQ